LPIRPSYDVFYKIYQDLDGLSPNRGESFLKLEADGADFRTMAENVIKTQFPDAKMTEVLYGNSIIFMSSDFEVAMNKKLRVVQKEKTDAIEVMMGAYKSWKFAIDFNNFRHIKVQATENAKQLLLTWNSKIEYMKFKKLLRSIYRMQINFKTTNMKREIRLQKYVSNIIGRTYKFWRVRKIFMKANKLATCLNNCKRKL